MTDDDIKTAMEEAKDFIDSLKWATECGLEVEFIQFFLEEFKRTNNVYESIMYAYREWDL